MHRRLFLKVVVGGSAAALGCTTVGERGEPDPPVGPDGAAAAPDAHPAAADAGGAPPAVDATSACRDAGYITMHDTNAQALYLDGTYGPLTGVIKVDYILANIEITLDFWHGHGGQLHRFTLTPAHFAALKEGERVYVTTTEVESHMHELFIDPVDPDYRVPGAPDIPVPRTTC